MRAYVFLFDTSVNQKKNMCIMERRFFIVGFFYILFRFVTRSFFLLTGATYTKKMTKDCLICHLWFELLNSNSTQTERNKIERGSEGWKQCNNTIKQVNEQKKSFNLNDRMNHTVD